MSDSIPARLLQHASATPDRPAYHVRDADGWKPTSYATYAAEMLTASRAMIALGVAVGDRVCIAGFNRPEWTLFDLAAMCAGAAPAGIYTTSPDKDVAYILQHSGAVLVLVEDQVQLDKVRAARADLPNLRHVIGMKGLSAPDILTWEAFLAHADAVTEADARARIDALRPEQLATLVYTSGTTGFPKGVMLSHENLTWTATTAIGLVGLQGDDCSVSYLPLSHIAEQMFSLHIPISAGGSIYFARSMEKLPEDLKEVQPTVFVGVPRVWEKFHAGVAGRLKEATGIKARLLSWARGVGTAAAAELDAGRTPSGFLGFQYQIAGNVIFKKLKPAIGLGRARVCVSGAAPISADVLAFFDSLDIRICEVYGQSEGSGPTSFNAPYRRRAGSVGPALPGVEVKIAADGEIVFRGKNVFLGYFNDPAATEACLVDGWLHSGDVGAFEDDFLRITGRKKEILITAGGKNIAPIRIESLLKSLELVSEAVAIADRRRFVSALLVLEPQALERFGAAHGLTGDLHAHPKVREALTAAIEGVNAQLMQVEHVRNFHVVPHAFSVEGGELTPSLKVKRRIVEQKYAGVIDAMYVER